MALAGVELETFVFELDVLTTRPVIERSCFDRTGVINAVKRLRPGFRAITRP